jgi:UDP-N-acetylmuramate--alanine ligase
VRDAAEIGRGLAPARVARAIRPREHIHVIGAVGAGASAAALLAHESGALVTGCDPAVPSPYTPALDQRGIHIRNEHAAIHVEGPPQPDRLAVTKALTSVQPDHPELAAARRLGIAIEPWQQTVADAAINQGGRLVAIAGTHGKSTSAGWLVHVLVSAGLDPGAFVGALLPGNLTDGTPATGRWGHGDVFVVEADEYAGNFDPYRPAIAVVLNAEWDHPDVFTDRTAVVDAFEHWLRAPGADARTAVIGTDDAGGLELAQRLHDWGERVISVSARRSSLPKLRLPGVHNEANAACVSAAAQLLGLDASVIDQGIASYPGVGRRFEVKGEVAGVLIIDDYGHHPTAIRSTVATVRQEFPGRRLWLAHEPLTYHRAAAMHDDLADALATADEVVIADIWAGRDPDTTITSAAVLAAAVSARTGRPVVAAGSPEATAKYLVARVEAGDVVLAMGGGRSYIIADHLLAQLARAGAE